MTAQQVIDLIRLAQTPEQIREANQAASALFAQRTNYMDGEIEAVRQAKTDARTALLDAHEYEQQQALRYIALNGKRYNLDEWLTPVEYARQYGLRSANNVTNWMMRGIIPPTDIIDVPELNGLRLVRNRVYKPIQPVAQ